MANDNFHALKLSPDLIHLQQRGNQKRAQELDLLCQQEIGHSETEWHRRDEKRDKGHIRTLIKKFTSRRA
jgi:hypothetical protein